MKLPADVIILEAITPAQCASAAHEIYTKSQLMGWSVWAFDVEWVVDFQPGQQRRISLVQMCNEKVCILFHVHRCGMHENLVKVLESKCIFKLGLNINGDVRKLERDFEAIKYGAVKSVIDIRDLADEVDRSSSRGTLADLTRDYLGEELEKPFDIRGGNWERSLTQEQKHYAALDVYTPYQIYKILIARAVKKRFENTSCQQQCQTYIREVLDRLAKVNDVVDVWSEIIKEKLQKRDEIDKCTGSLMEEVVAVLAQEVAIDVYMEVLEGSVSFVSDADSENVARQNEALLCTNIWKTAMDNSIRSTDTNTASNSAKRMKKDVDDVDVLAFLI